MSNQPVRLQVDSLDPDLEKTVTLTVESQGSPRKKLLKLRVNREQLSRAISNYSGGLSANNVTTTVDAEVIP